MPKKSGNRLLARAARNRDNTRSRGRQGAVTGRTFSGSLLETRPKTADERV
jgi:hypothetical protein